MPLLFAAFELLHVGKIHVLMVSMGKFFKMELSTENLNIEQCFILSKKPTMPIFSQFGAKKETLGKLSLRTLIVCFVLASSIIFA